MFKEIEALQSTIAETLNGSDFTPLSVNPEAQQMTFGSVLARIRKRTGLSQRALDSMSGVDHSTIARLEAGDRSPSISTVLNLAEALKLKPDMLQAFQLVAFLAREDDMAYINDIARNQLTAYGLNNCVSKASTSIEKAMEYKERRKRSIRQIARIGGMDLAGVSRFFKGERSDILGSSFISLAKGLGLTTREQIMDFFYSFA
jgi:transcriptional regulator with XRE-family HTH domain